MNALDPIRERLNKATPGPWARYGDLGHEVYAVNAHEDDEHGYIAEAIPREQDATFIANAPADIRKLLAAVEAVEKVCDELDEVRAAESGWPNVKSHASNCIRRAITAALGGVS